LAAKANTVTCQLTLAAIALCTSACSLGLGQPQVVAGRWFPEAELGRIQRGAPTVEVRRVGGPPLETATTPEGERWRYSMTVEQNEQVKLLGVIPLPPRRSVRTFEVVFLVRDGTVSEVTSRDSARSR